MNCCRERRFFLKEFLVFVIFTSRKQRGIIIIIIIIMNCSLLHTCMYINFWMMMMQKPSFNGRREPYFMREIIVPPANYKPVDTKMRLSLSILENEQHHETEDWEEQER